MIIIKPKNGQSNLILEIKALRQHLEDRYGVTGGLKEAKDLLDSVSSSQNVELERLASINRFLDLPYQDKIDLYERLKSDLGLL